MTSSSVLRGCNCYRAISVDGQYDIEYNKLIGKFFYNESSNSTVMYTDEDVHKFYRYCCMLCHTGF